MNARLPAHNDLPTFEDKLERETLVRQVAREVAIGRPPLVFGIHGDWGSGKTSFLCQLEHELTGSCSSYPESKDYKRACGDIENVFTVWFEAWRYQHEPSPVVALLQEICHQLPKHEKIKKVIKKWGTVITKGFFGAVDELSLELVAAPLGAGGKAGLKFKNPLQTIGSEADAWDKNQLSGRLTTNHVREQLAQAISKMLDDKGSRVCVIIDDLDRCDPVVALRLLEGIKVYLALPQCVFVLGVNIRQIELAIAPLLPGGRADKNDAQMHAEAAEYLEKLCTLTWNLPFLGAERRGKLLALWLADPPEVKSSHTTPLPSDLRDRMSEVAVEFDCLPANPRKIKGLANTVRQLAARAWCVQAKPKTNLPIPIEEADALIVAAAIYHFHPELLRFLQTSKNAWVELVTWANGKAFLRKDSDLHQLFETLRPTMSIAVDAGKSPTPSSAERISLYADPTNLNVFRVQDLFCKATDPQSRDSITYERMKRYLDLP